jgi:D-tyrosyl-tRNA(Tyr) deacylase
MRLILQRVLKASVTVEGREIAKTGRGLLILAGIGQADSESDAGCLAGKCAHLRIFEDAAGKTNLSILDVGGEALVVPQFTLYADARKGRRPSFTDAAPPEKAALLVDYFAGQMEKTGVPVKKGGFGAHMLVELINDGPFTIILESPTTSTSISDPLHES